MGFFTKSKNKRIKEYKESLEVATLMLFGKIKNQFPEEASWLWNPYLELNANKSIPVLIYEITNNVLDLDEKMELMLLKDVILSSEQNKRILSIYRGWYEKVIKDIDSQSLTGDEATETLKHVIGSFICVFTSNEYDNKGQKYIFNDEFAYFLGDNILNTTMELNAPLLQR